MTLNDGGQEIQIVEVVVAEGIALGRRDARIGICEVLIGGTVTVGGNHEVLSIGCLHDLYAASSAIRAFTHDGEAVILHECGELMGTREGHLAGEHTDTHATAVELGVGIVLLVEHAVGHRSRHY